MLCTVLEQYISPRKLFNLTVNSANSLLCMSEQLYNNCNSHNKNRESWKLKKDCLDNIVQVVPCKLKKRVSDMSILTSGFFHELVFPGP